MIAGTNREPRSGFAVRLALGHVDARLVLHLVLSGRSRRRGVRRGASKSLPGARRGRRRRAPLVARARLSRLPLLRLIERPPPPRPALRRAVAPPQPPRRRLR